MTKPKPKPKPISAFRPAADVVRDLLAQASPRARKPKREAKEDPSIHRYVDLRRITVSAVDDDAGRLTLILGEVDTSRINTAAIEAVRVADWHRTGSVMSPISGERAPTLSATIKSVPDELVAGSILDLRIGLRVDLKSEPVIVSAVVVRIDAIRAPAVEPVRITLGEVTMGPLIPVAGVPVDDVADEKMSRWLSAALAYQDRQRAKRR